MHVRNLAWMGLLTAMLAAPCAAQTPPADPSQIDTLRQELAELKLALQKTQAELEQLREFLAEQDVAAKLEEWSAEREDLLEQRRLLAMERTSLETARRALHQETFRQAQESAAQADKDRKTETEALQPKWSAQYMLGLIETDQSTIYLTSIPQARGYLLAEQHTDIDRRNVMVRGTFQNKSLESWRYTFEIRIAGDDAMILGDASRLLGVWRYQTPVLGPGDLHNFEVKVPVSDAQDIGAVQITNVTADRPAVPATQSVVESSATPATPMD